MTPKARPEVEVAQRGKRRGLTGIETDETTHPIELTRVQIIECRERLSNTGIVDLAAFDPVGQHFVRRKRHTIWLAIRSQSSPDVEASGGTGDGGTRAGGDRYRDRRVPANVAIGETYNNLASLWSLNWSHPCSNLNSTVDDSS